MRFLPPLLDHLARPPGKLLVSQVTDIEPWRELVTSADEAVVLHRRRSAGLDLERSLKEATVIPAAFPREVDFDTALIELPQGRDLARALIYKTLEAVGPGGSLYIWGENRAGMRPIEADFRPFGAEVVAAGGGERLFHLPRPGELAPAPASWNGPWAPRPLEVAIGPHTYTVMTQPGVFSWEHLDPGTATLLEVLPALQLHPARLLDACCGSGILGLAGGRMLQAESVCYADDDVLAVECCRATTGSQQVFLADLTREMPPGTFDLVLCNPPFHQGLGEDRGFLSRFLTRLGPALAREGELVVVANRFLPYLDELAKTFTDVEPVAKDPRWQVLRARGVRGRPFSTTEPAK